MEWLLVVAAVVIGVPAAAWLAQDSLIFFPQPLTSTAHLPAHAARLVVSAADGTRLAGWFVRANQEFRQDGDPAPTVIYFGGNAEEVSHTLADPRWPREWSIVAINYRGYGTSEGKPGEQALFADALAIYDAVARRDGVDPKRIVVFGRSLGTAVATQVAAERPVAGVILVSPYDSLSAVGRHHYPFLPVSLLLKHRFDAESNALRCRMPLLTVVASDDSIIPVARSQALYNAWAGPKSWRVVPNADHNSLGTAPDFWDGVTTFLAQR